MASRPTVIVMAINLETRPTSGLDDEGHGLDAGTAFALTLHHAMASLLPMVVVATPAFASLACSSVAARDVIVVPPRAAAHARDAKRAMGGAIAAGVWARPDSPGWVVFPADLPMLRPSTIRAVAGALDQHTVAYAQHLGRPGHPIGFGAELYSELVTGEDDDLARRMMARYPAHAVEVDDAGALLDFNNKQDLMNLRAAHEVHKALRVRP